MLTLKQFDEVFSQPWAESVIDAEDVLTWMNPQERFCPPTVQMLAHIKTLTAEQQHTITMKYINVIREHFYQRVRPAFPRSNLSELDTILRTVESAYTNPMMYFNGEYLLLVERSLHALVQDALPAKLLYYILNRSFGEQLQSGKMWTQVDAQPLKILYKLGLSGTIHKWLATLTRQQARAVVRRQFAKKWTSWTDVREVEKWALSLLSQTLKNLVGEDYSKETVALAVDELADLRISELFDIVVDYPFSEPAIDCLKSCMTKSSQRAKAVFQFQYSCQQRLLQGGTNTVDIIKFYLSTIRAFSMLEPRGVLLDKVSRPIRRYLREREDTIRVIVSGLLGEGEDEALATDLANEFADTRSSRPIIDDQGLTDMNWNPEPMDVAPDFMKGHDDIVTNLLSIYDNKEIFIKEFVEIFAERMLREDCVASVKSNVELLKMRFGDRELHNLDVMVRDMADSEQLDKKIHEEHVMGRAIFKKFHASMLSHLFWPKFRSAALELPPAIASQMDLYATRFSAVKSRRKLKWIPNLGTVDLEIQLQDRQLKLQVSPEQAAIIAFFSDGPHTLQDVETQFKMTATYARQIVMFWVYKGVLKQQGDLFIVQEFEEKAADDGEENDSQDTIDEPRSSIQNSDERNKEEMNFYWSYINGMLTNLGSVPLDRIHGFLKMVVPKETPYTKTVEQLEQFLNSKVNEELLIFSGGSYRLGNK